MSLIEISNEDGDKIVIQISSKWKVTLKPAETLVHEINLEEKRKEIQNQAPEEIPKTNNNNTPNINNNKDEANTDVDTETPQSTPPATQPATAQNSQNNTDDITAILSTVSEATSKAEETGKKLLEEVSTPTPKFSNKAKQIISDIIDYQPGRE